MTAHPDLRDWAAQRDAALAQVARNAGASFAQRAAAFVLGYLAEHSQASGEDITDACRAAGIVPENTDRAFGPVYKSLAAGGRIEKCGFVARTKGHLTSGGNLWRLSK